MTESVHQSVRQSFSQTDSFVRAYVRKRLVRSVRLGWTLLDILLHRAVNAAGRKEGRK